MWLYVQSYVRLQNIKLLEENTGRIFFDINYSNVFLDLSTKAKETKAKRNKWGLIKLKLLLSKGRHQQDKTTTYEAGKNICKWYDKYGVSIQKTQTTQHQNTVHLKTGRRPEQTLYQRRHTDCQKEHEKINIIKHLGNSIKTTMTYHPTPVR